MTEDLSHGENVIAVRFEDGSNAYEAMTHLKELDNQGQLALKGAAVVVRGETGEIEIKDEVVDGMYTGTATGGLIGLIIGILGGPFGVLIGGATGVLIGSLFDLNEEEETESAISQLSSTVVVGQTSLLAELDEQGIEVVDTAMDRLGGTVRRRRLADVKAEIAAAEKAQRAAKKEARKELIKAKHHKHQKEIDAKIDELKAKLHINKKAATTAS